MKIMMLSYSDHGGAGNAAQKIFSMLRKRKISTDLFVKKKINNTSKNFKLSINQSIKNSFVDILNYSSNMLLNNNFTYRNSYRSLGWFGNIYSEIINNSKYDIVQLHWINNFLSIKDIGEIKKPLIWRLSDMWPFSGSKHYSETGDQEYVGDKISLLDKLNLLNIDKFTQIQKIIYWKKKIQLITPSHWLKKLVRSSNIMGHWPVEVIYTPIDHNVFKPISKCDLRKKYNISNDERVIIFGANQIFDKRKGLDKILDIFKKKIIPNNKYTLLVFGLGELPYQKINNLKIINLGYTSVTTKLIEFFNLADVMLIPSAIDNLPQIGLEAQSCGLPLIVFDNSGLSELVEHGRTGYLAENNSIKSLSFYIKLFFNDHNKAKWLSKNARIRSKTIWSEDVIFEKYNKLYRKILKDIT
jgi:glycosyltransferase involved in cell wall biosynthesis